MQNQNKPHSSKGKKGIKSLIIRLAVNKPRLLAVLSKEFLGSLADPAKWQRTSVMRSQTAMGWVKAGV